MLRRLVRDPERCVADGELGDHRLVVVGAADPVDLLSAESRLVELDGRTAASDGELGQDPSFHASSIAREAVPPVLLAASRGRAGPHMRTLGAASVMGRAGI